MYKTHKASVLSYSQTITAPWLYFAHDFLSNQRSNVQSRTNRIFSRVVFLERKLGVSVFSSLFMWGGISPVESDFEWQSQRKNHFKNGFSLYRRLFTSPKIYLVRRFLSSLSFIDRELFCFPPIFSFWLSSDLWSGILPSFLLFFSLFSFFFFLSFHFFLFFLFTFPSPIPFFGKSGLAFYLLSLEEIPLSFASGERMRIPFLQAKVQKGLRLCFNGVFYRGNPILISGAKQIWVSRCRSRAELPYHSIRHAWQWWFENNVQN